MFDISPSRGSDYVNDIDYGIQSSAIRRHSRKATTKHDPRNALNVMDSRGSFGNKLREHN